MAWTVTLEILACADSAPLAGATVFDGSTTLVTDSSGRLSFSRDDTLAQFLVKISKAGYISKNKTVAKADAGTVRTECLNASPVGTNDPNVPTGAGGDPGGCFIVSAATGSATSDEVDRLRRLRDRVSARSAWGGELIARIYQDYASFSPAVADALTQDPVTRQVALTLIVRPLLAWYSLASALAFHPDHSIEHSQGCQAVLNACLHGDDAGPIVIRVLEALQTDDPLPHVGHPFLIKFIPRLRAAAGRPYVSWALLEPLIRIWRASLRQDPDLVEQVAQWLAGAAIETLDRPKDRQQFEDELNALAAFFDFHPGARTLMGQRLLMSWPDSSGALANSGFLDEHKPT